MTLKKITKRHQKKGAVKMTSMLAMVFLGCFFAQAQIYNNGSIYIGDSGSLYMSSGSLNLAFLAAKTTTSRTATSGKLTFGTSTTHNASPLRFVDGHVKALGTSFKFPTGQGVIFAPAAITDATAPTEAVYATSANPLTLDPSISAVDATGNWTIKGAFAKVVLSWNTDHSALFNNDLSNVTIAGYDGTKWIEVPSSVDAINQFASFAIPSSLSYGSVTTLSAIDLSAYTSFTLARKGVSCGILVPSSGVTKTWNGGWSPSEPTLADPVVINSDYAGSLDCNSLVLNANITLTGTQSVEIVNGATGTGKILMTTNASVVQRASGATPPAIELTKVTTNKKALDYVYWGTPIQGNFFSSLANAQATGAPAPGAFDIKYKYVSGTGGGWQTLTQVETGKGFITRVAPVTPFTTPTAQATISMLFSGTANNGNVVVPVVNNPAAPNGGTSHNLLANPYPSSIDAIEFLKQNTSIDGVVYIWTSSTTPTSTAYAKSDYIAYNLAGSVVSSPGGIPFNGKIASGQSFNVKALGAGNVTFTNCMRLKTNTALLYRQEVFNELEHVQADRFKLNLMDEEGAFSQILIAYTPEATLGYDRMYDAGRNSASTVQLYSIFEEDQRKLAINARPAFDATDVVALGISQPTAEAKTLTIDIEEKEGIFASGQTVYLYDKLYNTYHDLNNGPVTITTAATNTNSRFEVVYENATLANPDFDNTVVMARIKDATFSIETNTGMQEITIYDMTGRLIAQYKANGTQTLSRPFGHAQGVYIAKIVLDNGSTATQKLITQ